MLLTVLYPRVLGGAVLPLILQFDELGRGSRAGISDQEHQSPLGLSFKFRFLGPTLGLLCKGHFWTQTLRLASGYTLEIQEWMMTSLHHTCPPFFLM